MPPEVPEVVGLTACPPQVPEGAGLTACPPQVPEIVSVLRSKLQETGEEHVRQATQNSVSLLASQHCEAVVSSLLGSPLPFDRYWGCQPSAINGL